ncbi:10301_t:CDS:2 [Scutellospora calospora]|uniref:10301_t:CDS:1 n=1 Tax=Scutellospora calospora TaxID=85575 RepID=A0ACA9KXA1_9GLOM|nr:10301_t:CDS:2 [Scutellospora calospora]
MSNEFSCFFYGSLVSPEVIRRVLSDNGNEKITVDLNSGAPAVLKGYKRHKVRGAWYPAIIKSKDDETKGVVFKGLTYNDLLKLDYYEGDQYKRVNVEVFVNNSTDPIPTQTYVWIASNDLLENEDWSFDEFKKQMQESNINLFE